MIITREKLYILASISKLWHLNLFYRRLVNDQSLELNV